MNKWHMMGSEQVFKELKTSKSGLSETEASARLRKYGTNQLKSRKRKNALVIFLEQFKSFLVILLLIAVGISIFLGFYSDLHRLLTTSANLILRSQYH